MLPPRYLLYGKHLTAPYDLFKGRGLRTYARSPEGCDTNYIYSPGNNRPQKSYVARYSWSSPWANHIPHICRNLDRAVPSADMSPDLRDDFLQPRFRGHVPKIDWRQGAHGQGNH